MKHLRVLKAILKANRMGETLRAVQARSVQKERNQYDRICLPELAEKGRGMDRCLLQPYPQKQYSEGCAADDSAFINMFPKNLRREHK